jgi:hypothetical protein
MTPFPHFFFFLGYVDVEATSLQRGIELSHCDHYGLFLPRPLPWYSALQWVCFMLNESMRGKLISPLTRFPNGRKRKLRPTHSLDQGDWTRRAAINGFPRQLSKRGG